MRILRTHLFAVAVLAATALALSGGVAPAGARTSVEIDAGLYKAIRHYRATTFRLRLVMGGPAPRFRRLRHVSLHRLRTVWRHRAVFVRSRYVAGPPHRQAWLCIHRFEGSWNDGGGPYYGGLQMDLGFQQRYGRLLLREKGTAEHWTPLEQMWTAEVAYRSGRGFYPWPNTARSCGLI